MLKVSITATAALASFSIAGIAAGQRLSVEQTEDTIVIRQDGRDVLTYNKRSPQLPEGIDPVYRRSGCLHPVRSPQGQVVTAMFPFDHPHQQGIFSAWVKTTYDGRPLDFWNLARKSGRVLHERVVGVFDRQEAAGFEVDLIHRAEAERTVDVLHERWRITVRATEGDFHCFDLEIRQSALTDKPLVVEKYHYGGIAFRGPTRWLTPQDQAARQRNDFANVLSGMVNDRGSDRVAGNHQHARWVALWGQLDDRPVSLTVLSHPGNFRAPQAARLHPTKPYFCFSPCVDDAFVIDRDHPYVAKYRVLIADSMPDRELVESQWAAWCEP
jgi:hypothetical protein